MILINDVKYACLECIRGHRSSLCRHHRRPLLQVRSKGRPSVLASTNKNHRIAVFAQELAEDSDLELANCKDTPVVILKASDKHVVDLRNGRIVGPYSEYMNKARPMISPESFVNARSCCSDGVSKARKSCLCNHREVLKKKILSSYLQRRKDVEIAPVAKTTSCCSSKPKSSCCSKTPDGLLNGSENGQNGHTRGNGYTAEGMFQNGLSTGTETKDTLAAKANENLMASYIPLADPFGCDSHTFVQSKTPPNGDSDGQVFEVLNVQPCSIPGSCKCSADCRCPDCVVHNNAPLQNDALKFLNNDAQYGSNLVLTLADSKAAVPREQAYNAFLHQLLSRDTESPGPPSPAAEEDNCTCADDACFCTNCDKHGIIEGYKLDDIFGGRPANPS